LARAVLQGKTCLFLKQVSCASPVGYVDLFLLEKWVKARIPSRAMARYGNPLDDNYSYGDEDLDSEFLKGARREQKFKEIEERAIKSSEASLNILRETEEIGIRTAEVSKYQLHTHALSLHAYVDTAKICISFSRAHMVSSQSHEHSSAIFNKFKSLLCD